MNDKAVCNLPELFRGFLQSWDIISVIVYWPFCNILLCANRDIWYDTLKKLSLLAKVRNSQVGNSYQKQQKISNE